MWRGLCASGLPKLALFRELCNSDGTYTDDRGGCHRTCKRQSRRRRLAIAGAFGLVRFRSAPGTAREIAVIFIAMAAGLAFGMGYLAYGAIFLLASGVLLYAFGIFVAKADSLRGMEKKVKVTIPEALDYTSVFDDIFSEYTEKSELETVKSTNMGSMFRLTYRVTLKNAECEKPMIDAIRTRNGNLEIQCSRADINESEL